MMLIEQHIKKLLMNLRKHMRRKLQESVTSMLGHLFEKWFTKV